MGDLWDNDPFPDGSGVSIQHVKTGRYLALQGGKVVLSNARFKWFVNWRNGFIRLNDDGDTTDAAKMLALTDRFKDASPLEMADVIQGDAYISPFNRYDAQEWHLIGHGDGSYCMQNTGNGYVCVAADVPRMQPISGGFEERWSVKAWQ